MHSSSHAMLSNCTTSVFFNETLASRECMKHSPTLSYSLCILPPYLTLLEKFITYSNNDSLSNLYTLYNFGHSIFMLL